MINLMNLELRKLFRTKSFYIITLVSLLLTFLNIKIMTNVPNQSVYTAVHSSSTYGMLLMMCDIFTSIFICEDQVSGTLKNIYSKGYSRRKVFFAKYLSGLIALFMMYILGMLFSYICSLALWNSTGVMPDKFFLSLLTKTVLIISEYTLFYVAACILGKTGASIAFNIVAPTFIPLILALADNYLKIKSFTLKSFWIEDLISTVSGDVITTKNIATGAIVGILYICIFLVVGEMLNNRKEL